MKNKFVLVVFITTISSIVLAISFAGLSGEQGFRDFGDNLTEKYANGAGVQERIIEENYSAEGISEISITTIGTDVRFEPSIDGKIHLKYVYKKINPPGSNADAHLEVTKREGAVLHFLLDQYSTDEERKIRNAVGVKELLTDVAVQIRRGAKMDEAYTVIRIPTEVQKVTVKGVSGDIEFENQRLRRVAIVLVSGDVNFKSCEVDELEHKSVSGDLDLLGAFAEVNSQTVSGELKLRSRLPSPTVHFNTTSGDAEIRFGDMQPDIRIDFDTTSGEFRSREQSRGQSKRVNRSGSFENQVMGSAKGLIKIKSISGDVRIE